MRARDLDRAEFASTLDAAYAEGQLEAGEYHDRIAAARAARTLGELAALTADLQAAGVVRPRPAPPPRPARGYPPDTRARDTDREAAAELLTRAFGEGQLTEAEYRAHTELLADATTLADLADLTDDLQGPRHTPVAPRPVGARPSGRYLAVLAVAAVAVTFGAFALTSRDTDPAAARTPVAAEPEVASPAPPEPRPVTPEVIATPDLLTGPGLAQFLADYRAEFGDTLTDDISLFPEHASVQRSVPGQPNRLAHYTYRWGFRQDRDITTRKLDTPVIDLATVDLAAVAAVAADAGALMKVPDGKVSMIQFKHHPLSAGADRPVVAVYADNSFDESGHLLLDLSGAVLRVWPFEG